MLRSRRSSNTPAAGTQGFGSRAILVAATGVLVALSARNVVAADTDKRSSDLDGNGLVDVADLRVVLDALSRDGVDNAAAMEDLLAILADWGSDTWDLRLEEFGLSRDRIVDLGDGRFQIALDPAVGTEMRPWLDDTLEWEYVGQAVYVLADDRRRFTRVADDVIDDDGVTDTITRLLKTEMEDVHGRLFRVKRVDRERLEATVADYNHRIAEDFGHVEESVDVGRDHDLDDPALDADDLGGSDTPFTWYRDSNGARWNSDNRNRASTLSTRMTKVVAYFVGDWSQCSGILIGDNWVLTAAHCAKTCSTAWIYPKGQVCTNGAGQYSGSQCSTVICRWGNASWSGCSGSNKDFGDDIVIMEIADNLGSGNYMALSQASNSYIKDHDAYHSGYPGLTPGGSSNTSSCSGTDSAWSCQMSLYWMYDDVNKTSTKKIGTKVDSSLGMSGGPIYYYPGGYTSDGAHYLTGIMAGHHDGWTKSWNGGPKIPYHRDWILGIID